ncbi:MAG: hypothetical protein ACTS6G_00645 [Candidatus Hodgkinia cicadicola]
MVSAQSAIPFKSWTTRMFRCRLRYSKEDKWGNGRIHDRRFLRSSLGVREACTDLIYHILLPFVGFQIRNERLFETLQAKLMQLTSTTSLMCLESIALEAYRDIKRERFVNGRKFETSTAIIIRKLYSSVASLTVLCLKINTTVEVNEKLIVNALREVFVNIIMLLYSAECNSKMLRTFQSQDVAIKYLRTALT